VFARSINQFTTCFADRWLLRREGVVFSVDWERLHCLTFRFVTSICDQFVEWMVKRHVEIPHIIAHPLVSHCLVSICRRFGIGFTGPTWMVKLMKFLIGQKGRISSTGAARKGMRHKELGSPGPFSMHRAKQTSQNESPQFFHKFLPRLVYIELLGLIVAVLAYYKRVSVHTCIRCSILCWSPTQWSGLPIYPIRRGALSSQSSSGELENLARDLVATGSLSVGGHTWLSRRVSRHDKCQMVKETGYACFVMSRAIGSFLCFESGQLSTSSSCQMFCPRQHTGVPQTCLGRQASNIAQIAFHSQ